MIALIQGTSLSATLANQGLAFAPGFAFYFVATTTLVTGALFMFYGSVLLIIESRMAMGAISSEMDFVWKVSTRYAAGELSEARGGPATWLGKKMG